MNLQRTLCFAYRSYIQYPWCFCYQLLNKSFNVCFNIFHKPGLCFASILQLSPGSFIMSESGFFFSFRWERNDCPGVGMNFISPGYCPTTLPAHELWWCIRHRLYCLPLFSSPSQNKAQLHFNYQPQHLNTKNFA